MDAQIKRFPRVCNYHTEPEFSNKLGDLRGRHWIIISKLDKTELISLVICDSWILIDWVN